MSKEYTYLETIAEIFKDKSKRFIDNKTGEIMFFNKGTDSLNIELDSANIIEELIVNDSWINSKWTLIEEKKNYNVRTYTIGTNILLKSETLSLTKDELKALSETLVKTIFNKHRLAVKVIAEEIIITN